MGNALAPLLSSSLSNHVCQCYDLLILGYKNLLISIRTAPILTPPTSFLQLILASLSDPAAPNSKIKQTLIHKQKWEHKKNKREAGWSANRYLFCLCLVKTQIPAKVPSVMRCRSWTATSSLKKIKKFSYKENVCLSATKQILFFFCNKQNSVCLQGLKSSSVILLGVEDHGDQITPMHKSDQKFSISCSLWHLGSRISTRTDG